MDDLVKKLFAFGLHDTFITKIEVHHRQIHFFFPGGVYTLDHSGKETALTEKCTLAITLDNAGVNPYDLFEIQCFSPKCCADIAPEDVVSIVRKEPLAVQNVYFSRFNHTVLFEAGNTEGLFLLKIENCIDFAFVFG